MSTQLLVGTFAFAYARPGGATTHRSLIPPVASLSESVWRPDIPSGPIPPPPPHPPPPPIVARSLLPFLFKEFSMADATVPRVISGKQLNKVNGGFTVTIANPLDASYVGLPAKGTTLGGDVTGNDCVLSVPPGDGTPQVRTKGTAGSWEVCQKQNGLLVWMADDHRYVLPFAE